MALIAFDPEIPVLDRFAKGFPEHAEGEPATYGPFSEAATVAFPFDAHFCAYALPAIPRRLATQAALAYAPRMVLFVVDVDGPDHKCAPEWWAAERVKIHKLFKARGWGYAYTTKGGYRLVYGLRDELTLNTPQDAARWRETYLEWIALLAREFEIVADDKCADWTRLYRLPRVLRDGTPTEPAEEIGWPNKMLAWREPYIPADDPRCQRTVTTIEIPVAAPVSDDALEFAARALSAQWPRRGRHHASLALCGALARAGWSDEAIADFVAGVSYLSGGDPEIDKRLAQARSSLDKLARSEDISGWPQLAEHMCTGIDAQVDESRRPAVEAAVLEARRHLGQGPAIDVFTTAIRVSKPTTAVTSPEAIGEILREQLTEEAKGDARYATLLDNAASQLGPRIEALESKAGAVDSTPMGMSARTLMKRNTPPPQYLVERLIPREGVGAMSGEPKTGKSWDATHIAVCVASGKPVWGKFAVKKPERVFYFFAEDTEGAIKIRVSAIAVSLGLDPDGAWLDNLVLQPRGRALDIMSPVDLCVVHASVNLHGGASLVILDPLSNIHSGEEDKRDSMVKVMARLHALELELGAAVLFVHHSGKTSAENKGRKRGGQKMRGSSAVHGAVDFGIYVSDPQGNGETEFLAGVESEMKAARAAGKFARQIKITDDANGNATRAEFSWLDKLPDAELAEGKDLIPERAYEVVQHLFKFGAPMIRADLQRKMRGGSQILNAAVEFAIREEWVIERYSGKTMLGLEITEAGKRLIRGGGTAGGNAAPGTPQPPPTPQNPAMGFIAQIVGQT